MKKNVLLITNYFSNIRNRYGNLPTEYLYLLLSKVRFITLDIIDFVSVQKYELSNFKKYSAIVYDFVDCGYGENSAKFHDVILNYIKNGGSIFATHDQFDFENEGLQFPRLLNMLGLKYYRDMSSYTNKAIVTNKNHPIFYNYYNLTYLNVFETKSTHKSWSEYDRTTSATKLIDLVLNDGQYVDYLIVNNYVKGRTAMTRAGHSHSMSLDEEKIFINTLHWLLFGNTYLKN